MKYGPHPGGPGCKYIITGVFLRGRALGLETSLLYSRTRRFWPRRGAPPSMSSPGARAALSGNDLEGTVTCVSEFRFDLGEASDAHSLHWGTVDFPLVLEGTPADILKVQRILVRSVPRSV